MTMACIRKRRGKWVADYRDPSGRRRWITRDTRKEAEAALAAIHVAIAKDEYVAPDTTRTLQTVYDHWWRVAVMGSDNKRGKPLSQGSKGFYAGVWTRYFLASEQHQPRDSEAGFGPRRLRSITQAEVAEWKEALGQRVGPRTVLAAFQLLSTLFEHARRFGWAVRNPCEFVHAPSYGAKVRAFTPDEISALLDNADPDTILLIEVGAGSGLRESELFGVRFEDIDFKEGGVKVARQLQNGAVLAPKTEKSRRFVPLPPAIVRKLWEHPRRTAGGLVFVSPEGHAMHASNFHRRIWHPLLERAAIEPPMPEYFVGTRTEPDLPASRQALDEAFRQGKLSQADFDKQVALLRRWQTAIDTQNERGKITFHSLRHATATAAIASGANVQTVSSLLGHANPQITLTTYADEWAARLDQNTAAGIAGVLFGSRTVAEDKKVAVSDAPGSEESPEDSEAWIGGPCRSRTYDQEIKSLLLYQLS
jgi:integrase